MSSNKVNLSLDPTVNNGYATTTLKINVGTNNPTGYHLFLNADGSNNALVNTSDNTVTIDALPNNNTNNTGYDESNFPSNTWGYNSNGSSWSFVGSANYFPLSNTATEIDSSSTNTNNKETTISLAAKVDYSKPSGSYTKDLIISILPTISTYELNYNANTSETVTNLPLPLVMNHWANIAPAIPIDTASIPSRDGYNFKGYTTTPNGDTAEYVYDENTNTFSPATFTPASATALSDTLYAVWEEAGPKIITFTIDGEPYQAEEGMTWKDWIVSEYNIEEKIIAAQYTGAPIYGLLYEDGKVNHCDNRILNDISILSFSPKTKRNGSYTIIQNFSANSGNDFYNLLLNTIIESINYGIETKTIGGMSEPC